MLQTYDIEHKNRDILVDGWKWRVRGSTRLPAKDPAFCIFMRDKMA